MLSGFCTFIGVIRVVSLVLSGFVLFRYYYGYDLDVDLKLTLGIILYICEKNDCLGFLSIFYLGSYSTDGMFLGVSRENIFFTVCLFISLKDFCIKLDSS